MCWYTPDILRNYRPVPALRFLRLALAILVLSPLGALAQGTAFVDDRLPPHSMEVKPHDPPATDRPWQLPKPGDPLYNAQKEAQIKSGHSDLVYVFERGVFKEYGSLGSSPSAAKKSDAVFTRNPNLPPDAIELSPSEHGDRSQYYQTRPQTRPPNVPPDCILVRVFQGKTFLGWTWMSKDAVMDLHKKN